MKLTQWSDAAYNELVARKSQLSKEIEAALAGLRMEDYAEDLGRLEVEAAALVFRDKWGA